MSVIEISVVDIVWKMFFGVLIRASVGALVWLIKKYDKEHGLPKKVSVGETILIFLTGVLIPRSSLIEALIHFIIVVYLCFTAYTDHHTRMVYSLGAYTVGTIGLVSFVNRNCATWPVLIGFYGVVLLLTLCKILSLGDTEIFMATAPYLILYTDVPGQILGSFFLLSEIFVLVYAFCICRAKLRDFCAMAPAIALAAFILI